MGKSDLDRFWDELDGKLSTVVRDEKTRWSLMECLTDYMKAVVEERLDQEFNRGAWRN